MVPALTENGRSFKGAALYYLHDKRAAGEASRLTSDRVAWTETVNLGTDNADRAWRRMAHTAMAQAELKAAAGVKATGRKLAKPVLAYSLAWHPDEQVSKEEQLAAARETLRTLGLEDHQALIVAHRDEPHAHVHVLVNRVHPQTGVAAGLSNSKLRLSQWAQAYEEKRGPVRCPQRVANNERRRQGHFVREARVPRTTFEFNRSAGNDNLSAEFAQAEQTRKDAQLLALGRTLKESHARQWVSLKATYANGKRKLADYEQARIGAKTAEIKAAYKPQWRDLFQKQRIERQMFEEAETGFLSRLFNIAATYRELRRNHGYENNAIGAFMAVLSSGTRHSALAARQERERKGLSNAFLAELRAETKFIQQHTRRDSARLRDQFLEQCAGLRMTQEGEQLLQRAAWKARNVERKATMRPYLERQRPVQPSKREFSAFRDMRDSREQDVGRSFRRAVKPPAPK